MLGQYNVGNYSGDSKIPVRDKYFFLSGLNTSVDLGVSALTGGGDLEIQACNAEATIKVKIHDMKEMFQYKINYLTKNDGTVADADDDITYFINNDNNSHIDPKQIVNAIVDKGPMLDNFYGKTLTSDDQLIANDFLRFIGMYIFNNAYSNLISNEYEVKSDINTQLTNAFTKICNEVLKSGINNDNDESKFNICRELYFNLMKYYESRFDENNNNITNNNNNNLKNPLPFMVDDIICFKTTINLNSEQGTVTVTNNNNTTTTKQKFRTYLIKLQMVDDLN